MTTKTALTPVSVIVFPGGFNWPIWAAQEQGYFAERGIAVTLTPTPNSVFQLTNLIDGNFDIAHTAIDNVVAYMEGQGEAETQAAPDIVAFMGVDNGFLSLVTAPEVRSYADIKGKSVSVDAMTTGYAFVLFDMLRRNGLSSGDYGVERAGGVRERWQALQESKHAGTLLVTPLDLIARKMGFNVLQYAIDLYGHYQGVVGAARRGWIAENAGAVEAYIRGYRAGVDFLYQPQHRDEAIAILLKNAPQMTPEIAAASYSVMMGANGFYRTAEIDIEGVRKVLELRSEYGRPQKSLADPFRYYDPRSFEAATK